jgi:hypothetical protein
VPTRPWLWPRIRRWKPPISADKKLQSKSA